MPTITIPVQERAQKTWGKTIDIVVWHIKGFLAVQCRTHTYAHEKWRVVQTVTGAICSKGFPTRKDAIAYQEALLQLPIDWRGEDPLATYPGGAQACKERLLALYKQYVEHGENV